MEPQKYQLDTIALHSGYEIEPTTKSVEVPLYLTNAYAFENTQDACDQFALKKPGSIYTRLANPTVDVLEQRIAALDGGIGALAFASGHAAIFNTVVNLASQGDEIVASIQIYGGAINMLGVTLKRLGIHVTFVNPDDLEAWENAVTDKTRMFFVETVGNPNANVANLEQIGKIAHKHGIPYVVDSTFTTPALCRPIEFGADIVIHSATKFLGGHSNVMGGLVVDSGKFQYKDNPRFPLYNQPDESYHGLVYADLGESAFIARLRSLITRDLGACISPFNAFMLLQGIETLSLRMERHCENALKVAEYLEQHPQVEFVNCPMLKSSKYYELGQKYMPKGTGSVFTFGLKGTRETGAKFIDSLKLLINCANVGDSKSLVIHPATTTHSQLSAEQLVAAGITEGTIRLSIGLEDIQDIIADLDQAISNATK
ncbi:O-acetylhomoserine aminocarboxypropyltransferase/cysteine synthase family protein [Clostridium facile]|uniref:O-acetylhomoserine aminocarboxypropyltransferase/cysteine synthase n=1 Tax=Clostridium facile TaxID=2763035 RepID=A0ABR7IS47_9CLOT|nr:O-acetylhomoserine aminocarboxypropyltransferase/cysteine synthase family protein [Clostridium facile]MBC5787961.1 O-acetylhomoserine aminocarboxypropyltransferase/cysteine synthase [Clostridium facile]